MWGVHLNKLHNIYVFLCSVIKVFGYMPPKIIEMIQWDKPLSCTVWTTVHLKHILQCIFKSLNNWNICHGCMNVLKFLLDGCTKALFLKNWRRSDISHFHDLTNIENKKSCQKFRFFFFFIDLGKCSLWCTDRVETLNELNKIYSHTLLRYSITPPL